MDSRVLIIFPINCYLREYHKNTYRNVFIKLEKLYCSLDYGRIVEEYAIKNCKLQNFIGEITIFGLYIYTKANKANEGKGENRQTNIEIDSRGSSRYVQEGSCGLSRDFAYINAG